MGPLRIMAVDDEPSLLQLMRAFLGRLGHEVHLFEHAPEAILAVETTGPSFDLAIVDLTMPEMTGEELLRHLIAADPGLRVLVCSGYPFDVSHMPETVRDRIGFLQKPFLPTMLQREVTRLCPQPRASV